MTTLTAVELLGAGTQTHAGTFDIAIANGLVKSITASAAAAPRRLLAMPALVNAHDHARPLSTTSFGAGGKPLETWLLRLGAMPAIDPYQGALAAFGRAARAGAASVMAHYTRFHGPMLPVDEVRAVARAAADVGIRVTFAMFMRDRNPLVYGNAAPVLDALPSAARRVIEAQFMAPMPDPQQQIARVEAIATAVESPMFSVQYGPNGVQWCSDELLGAIAQASARTGRRVHMHLLETQYQRAFADRTCPEGVLNRLHQLGLLTDRLALAHCVYARPDELDLIARCGAVIVTNASSNLHLRSGVAPIGAAIARGCRVAMGVDGSALDEDDDVLREMRLGHFLHGGRGFDSVVTRADWLAGSVRHGRFANGAPGPGVLETGAPADILVLDLDRLDRDALMPVAPLDLVFGRATQAHVVQLFVAGREIVRDGRLTGVDLEAVETALRDECRHKLPARAPFLAAWPYLEQGTADFCRNNLGCC